MSYRPTSPDWTVEAEQLDVVAWLEAESRRHLQLTIDGGFDLYPDEPNPVPPPTPTARRRRNREQ